MSDVIVEVDRETVVEINAAGSSVVEVEVPGLKGDKGDQGDDGDPGDPGGSGAPGVVQSIVAGDNVTVDATDPANPIVSATGGGGSGGSNITALAGTDLVAGTVVGVRADGTVTALDWSVEADGLPTPLLASTDVSEGDDVVCVGFGPLTDVSWSWTPGVPLFVGPSGSLTEDVPTYPTAVFSRQVAVAVSATELFVDPQLSFVLTAGGTGSTGGFDGGSP